MNEEEKNKEIDLAVKGLGKMLCKNSPYDPGGDYTTELTPEEAAAVKKYYKELFNAGVEMTYDKPMR